MPVASRIIESCITTDSLSAEVSAFSTASEIEICSRYDDSCFLTFALQPRPKTTHGYYTERWSRSKSESIGDILFVPNGMTMVGFCQPGAYRTFVCNLSASLFTLNWEQLTDHALAESLNLRSTNIKRAIRRLIQETFEPRLASPLAMEAAAVLTAIDIQRHLLGLEEAPSRKRGGLSPARLRKIEERVRSDRPIPSLTELAAHCELSTRHLARAFREEVGTTIGEYINISARERACKLLRTTDLPVRVIAEQTGFSSAASFSYAFRRDTGLKPSDMRKSARKPPQALDS